MNRRSFIAATAVSPLIGGAEAKQTDPHPGWLDDWRAENANFAALCEEREPSEADEEASWSAKEAIASKIVGTPAKTKAGVLAQLDYWLEDWGASATCAGQHPQPEVTVIETIRAGLEGLAA